MLVGLVLLGLVLPWGGALGLALSTHIAATLHLTLILLKLLLLLLVRRRRRELTHVQGSKQRLQNWCQKH